MGVSYVFQEHDIQRGLPKRSDRFGNSSASCFDGNIFILFEINASVLLCRIIEIPEELFFEARIAATNNMFAVLPDTITKRFAGNGGFGARSRSRPVIDGSRAVPTIYVSKPSATRATAEATPRSSVRKTTSASLPAATGVVRGRGLCAGTSPAISNGNTSVELGKDIDNTNSPTRKSGIRSSPLHISEMRWDISRLV